MELLKQGKTAFTLAVSPAMSPAEAYAKEEFAKYFAKASRVTLEETPAAPGNRKTIVIGKTLLRAMGLEDALGKAEALGQDGYYFSVSDSLLAIAGEGERGTLYGVYSFLEKFLGCRWFTPEVEVIPAKRDILIPSQEASYTPCMEYREPAITECRIPEYAARQKINGHFGQMGEKYGGHVKYGDGYFVHTFDRLMPPEEFFDEHPEYYAEIDGVRLKEKTQLCLTNPDVLRIVTERILKVIESQPDATIFSVSQNDNYHGCTCETCRKVDAEEGSQAGALICFVNQVAEAVAEKFPNVVIDTLAYQYTRTPPKLAKPRENVCVRLCTIECCFVHPLAECQVDDPDAPKNDYTGTFASDLIGWGKICKRLYIWDYVTNFSHFWMPHPNFDVLAKNIRFFRDNNVKGVFEQGCPRDGGGEMTDLRSYILAKCLWDPDADPEELMDEFLAGVYGVAGHSIKKYLDTVYHAVVDKGCHLY